MVEIGAALLQAHGAEDFRHAGRLRKEGDEMGTVAPSREDVVAAVALVDQVDLAPINHKLRHDDPATWTEEAIAEGEQKYRRFLVLNLLHPHTTLSVDRTLDEYWHQHILDTRKYAEDCQFLFGYFLHHDPYFGLDEDGDEWLENVAMFSATQDLYEEAFGEPYSTKKRLTIDKAVGGAESTDDPQRIYAFPQSCKSGQHCNKIIGPEIFNPAIPDLPRKPITPLPLEEPGE
ncbi:glycine-rich domain-containing protein [Streptomyces luteolifulvus]|jgi:hypothetical protein|uniref:glycine-rich domain-containing protein n=1 Tax=Streptomyces luteolifulvus TaxID=2615112 RepID=UPI00178532AA|nr:hypothetical protein [Streptomyces luteolifulvus]